MSDTQALPPPTARNFESELHDWCAEHYANPLGWVRGAFAWGETGPLQPYDEPDRWQCEFLEWLGHEITLRRFDGVEPCMPIRGAVSSGHGIGKGALSGMLAAFAMSTRRNMKGTVTANTAGQLQDKTWASIQTWVQRAITAHWFELNTSIMYRKGLRAAWKLTPIACDPDNADAFQGQHAADSTSLMLFDEASNIQQSIYEAADGGMTDGEPWWLMFGNMTRRRGMFYDVVFGDQGAHWKTWIIDARNCRFSNKQLIAEQLADWGEDSDRFRVRVRGLPPNAEDAQFIDSVRVLEAQKRQVVPLADEPLVAGCDLAWGGKDSNVIRFRRGRDARSIPAIRIPGELTRDPSVLVNRLSDILRNVYQGYKVSMLFLDSAGIAGSVGTRLRELGHENILEVNFGADSPDRKFRYMRDYMWGQMKDWLLVGAIDKTPRLEHDLTAPGLREDLQQRVWLESKKEMKAREIPSPDDGDALCWVAGTQVRTPSGPRAIESLRVGEMVSTPMGARRVLLVHESTTYRLTTVRFSNGETLIGKGAHRIFTKTDGFVRADTLPLTFAVETDSQWERMAWWLWRQSSIAAKPSGFKAVAATISPATKPRRSDFYIGAFGLTCMGLFLKVVKSIIETMIGRTTSLTTCNCVSAASINVSTCADAWPILLIARDPWPLSPSPLPRHQHGTAVNKGEHGIENMPAPRGKTAWNFARSVSRAIKSFSLCFPHVQSSVPTPVSSGLATADNAQILARVRGVARCFWRTNIGLRATVVTAVQTSAVQATATYNLTVEHDHVYYANGVLVENCLTFAQTVAPLSAESREPRYRPTSTWG